jgi:hypothetical protein
MRGASGEFELLSFPVPGQNVVVEWSEPSQNFQIIDRTGSVTPTPTPTPPIRPTPRPTSSPTPNPSEALLQTLIGTWEEGFISTGQWRLRETRLQPDGTWYLYGFDELGNLINVFVAGDFGSDPAFEFVFSEQNAPNGCISGAFDHRGGQQGVAPSGARNVLKRRPLANVFTMFAEGVSQADCEIVRVSDYETITIPPGRTAMTFPSQVLKEAN